MKKENFIKAGLSWNQTSFTDEVLLNNMAVLCSVIVYLQNRTDCGILVYKFSQELKTLKDFARFREINIELPQFQI